MSAPRPAPSRTLRLPDLPVEGTPGAGLVRRAVSVVLLLLGGLLAITLVVAAVVSIDITADGSGILEPTRIWPVRTQEPGTVLDVLVATGDSVVPGQALVRLDTLASATGLAQLRATAAESRLTYEHSLATRGVDQRQLDERIRQAQSALLRARALLRQRLTDFGFPDNVDSILRTYRPGSHTAIDLALADLIAAEADSGSLAAQRQVVDAKRFDLARERSEAQRSAAQVALSREQLDRLTLRAPAAGVVLTERIERLLGAYEKQGDLVLEIGDPRNWQATLYVDERDVHEVHVGDEVKVEVQAFARKEDLLPARVVFVAQEPADARETGGYRVVATIDPDVVTGRGPELRRGYTVRGKILTRSGPILIVLWRYLTRR